MIGLIRADDLDRWASRITAAPEFPRLVRLLVHATARGLKRVDFPAEEAVRLGGWDGQVLAEDASPFVVSGFSVWELGTGHDPRAKANDDYNKRTQNPLDVDPRQATFVFATPRRWPGRDAWVEEKRAEGNWKDVLAFDAESLVQWLEMSPAVAAWLAPVVGALPADAHALEAVCDAFRAATKPALDLPGLLIGRDAERTKLLALLQGPPLVIEMSATTAVEAAAFVGACIGSLPEHERDALWSRAIWVDSSAGLRSIAVSDHPLLVVASGELPSTVTQHHFVKVCASFSTGGENAIELGAQPISALIEYFAKQGLTHNDAYELCREAGGYFERVRHRLLAVAPAMPEWAVPAVGVTVAAAILIGEWDESHETDNEIVSAVTGIPYEQFVRAIIPFQSGPSPLISRAGSVWKAYARPTAWKLLEPALTTRQLEVFLQSAQDVLLEPDPRFDLAPEERWMANMHGKRRAHSSHLRSGLSRGLLHAASLGRDDAACYAGRRAQSWVDAACRRLFEKRSEPGFWRRIHGELRELAEAAPVQFLTALEADLAQEQPQVLDLFEEEGEHGACLHADLLRALELLAWAPEHVGRAVLALASLAEHDPGGRWSNRPLHSLTEILLPWQPQCSTTAPDRKRLFMLITQRFPEVGWELGKSLMPDQTSISTPTARPKLRSWSPEKERRPVLIADYWAEIKDISERLVELADKNPERWYFLVSSLNSFMPPLKEHVLRGAEELLPEIQGDDRFLFWTMLRKLLHHHNQFSAKEAVEWVYSRELLDRLESLYARLTPDDPISQLAWLFDFHVERPTDVALDWREEREKSKEAQASASEILASLDLNVLIAAMPRFENHRLLGYCLGHSSRAEAIENALLRSCATSADERERELARGFSNARYETEPVRFMARWSSKESQDFITEQAVATMLQGLPACPVVWDAVEAAGPICRELYWKEVHIHLFDQPSEAEQVARNLLSVGRALAAIDLLAANVKNDWLAGTGDVRLIVEVLNAGVAEANANPAHGQRIAYDIARLIKALADSRRLEVSELMHLEWIYFGVLERQAQHELVIYERLISDPKLLLELIALIYIPEGESREGRPEPSEGERAAATQASRILNEWKPFAGTSSHEIPSAKELASIIERVRKLAAEKRYTDIVDDLLGKALASSPLGTDGVWPHESVRDALEFYSSEALADGFVVGKRNLRGVTLRSPSDGGEQERELAAQYEAWQRTLAVTHPHTSALLGRLAEGYRTEAVWEDTESLKR
ncbi:hypothetical protein [Billgrantia ethanolica]|uniref:Uncharacterized protein n=1 Tax=Billgrantia ethanolica TaxID=2733486 RepID=A0ABS9A8Y4_9GAMM|nr:hypothetical protein [Halomonas ethanolica]MCE8005279.1 hypothetical protein [Halomonas ethanolica]